MQIWQMEFAYSRTMQALLAVMSVGCTFVCYYLIATLILALYGATVSPRRRMLFSFFAGTLLYDAWAYGIYFLGGMKSFPPLVYALVTVPNPFFGLLYYYIGLKALKLSPTRSARIVCHIYLYIIARKSIEYLVNYLFFRQSLDVPFNYLFDTFALLVDTAISLGITGAAILFVRRRKRAIDLRDTTPIKSVSSELGRSFLISSVSYAVFVIPRLEDHADMTITYSLTVISTVLIFLFNLLWNVYSVSQTKIANKTAYVNSLVKSTDEFRSFRHDFRNVLQAYGGYLQLNDMDGLREYHESVVNKSTSTDMRFELTRRLSICPPKATLLLEKLSYAERLGVDFQMTSQGDFDTTDDRLEDSCRCMGCLLDNAIEAAAESERKMVLYSREIKANGKALIVITNSTRDDVPLDKCCEPGYTTKRNHKGLGLNTVRSIIDEIPYCTLNITYFQREFSVYIETRVSDEYRAPDDQGNFDNRPAFDSDQRLPIGSVNVDQTLDLSALTILIVDDNAFLLDTAKQFLEGLHIHVDTAENGLSGWERYLHNPDRYDLIFLDISMPIMDGIETASRIRESSHATAKTVPIIAITGNLLPDQSKMPLFDGVLHKPFAFEQLETMIRQYAKPPANRPRERSVHHT